MANCNKQFKDFDSSISIPDSKVKKMNDSRESARAKIKKWFAEHRPDYPISFWIQGSHKNSLNIRTKDDDCDQDDGIYVDRDPENSVDGTTLQTWILMAVSDITTEVPEHKKRCIRNFYKPYNLGSFHIDYPSYYKTDLMAHPMLTVKDGELEESDPEEFTNWLTGVTDDKGQLRRLIRYLKAWCDNMDQEMPNGLTMTVLACNNYVPADGRDDKAIYYTLRAIQTSLNANWSCIMPSTPFDDLLAGSTSRFKQQFMEALSSLIVDGRKALDHESKQQASKLWRKHLGDRFPIAPGNKAALGALVGSNRPYYDF